MDLKETLIDLDELLKKELEGVEKDVPEEDVKEPIVEAKPEKEEQKVDEKAEDEPKIEAEEEKISEILEVVSNKEKEVLEEKEDDVDDSDNKLLSRRVGRPRKTTETEAKTKPTIEEDAKVSKKKEKEVDVEKPKMSKPGSPRSRQASPSPEVKTQSGSREPPTKRTSNSNQEQIVGKKIEQPITKKVEPSLNKKLEQSPVKKPAPAPVETTRVESAPASPELTAEEIERQVWKKSILAVLGRIMQHKHAHLFNTPVSEAVAPEYRDLVYRPMDLGSIKKNIESGHISSTEGMLRDINLVFLNAIMYNSRYVSSESEVTDMRNALT